MRKIALTVLFVALVGAVMSPTAAAKQLHSNVVSWAPADVQPGMPVEVTLVLSTAGPTPYPKDGTPVAGVNEVEVVIRGEEETHRFATQDIGGGRYRTELIFPKLGGWNLRVRYAPGSYGHGDEVLLGKGAICVGGELCIGEQPEQSGPGPGGFRGWCGRL